MHELRTQDLLHKVTHICSVSGGSILAAHLVQNWQRYCYGNFEETAKPVLKAVQYDLRGKIVRQLLWRKLWTLGRKQVTATTLLADFYQKLLYCNGNITDLPKPHDAPQLEILSTSLNVPDEPCSFSQSNFSFKLNPTATLAEHALLSQRFTGT